ncbi:hypothetical protein ACFL2Q_16815 [Thermodesulfobacteriota bacterium]
MRSKALEEVYRNRIGELVERLRELEAADLREGAWFVPSEAREFLETHGLDFMLHRSRKTLGEQRRLAWAIATANHRDMDAVHEAWGVWQQLEGNDPMKDVSWRSYCERTASKNT